MPENEKMDDYTPDIITLEDEEGNEFSFEVIDAADYNDTRYLAVVPYKDAAAEQLEEDANLILMRVGEENGEEYLDVVEDDNEVYEVGAMFAQRLSELYDIDPEDLKEEKTACVVRFVALIINPTNQS